MSAIIEGRENVIRFTRSRAISALALEINTGMKISNRGSALQACQIQGLLEGRTTKKAGLKKAIKKMKELYPDWEVAPTVQKALDAK